MTQTPKAGAKVTAPGIGVGVGARINRRNQGLNYRISRRIGRMSIIGATTCLTTLAVVLAQFLNWLFYLVNLFPFSESTLFVGTIVTILTASPMCYLVMNNVHEMATSRRALSRMTEKLAMAFHSAEQANEAKSRFLANMSHELRTPLNAVIGFSDIMQHQRFGPIENPRYVDYAKDINASGTHLLSIINEILDLAKIESGEMTVEDDTEFELLDAIDAATTMLRPLAARQNVSVGIDMPNFKVSLRAVERMVRQVLLNVMSNAVKYTPAEGFVRVSFEHCSNGALAITVSDTGVGMTADELKIALTPFGQVSSKMSSTHQGTGLGLPLTKAMMEMHGGTLTIRSQPERGTSVTLKFPASRVIYQELERHDEPIRA